MHAFVLGIVLLLATLPTPESVLEQMFSRNRQITTYQCDFYVERHYSMPNQNRTERYQGVHRFREPDQVLIEYFPINEHGMAVSKERFRLVARDGHQTALDTSGDGRPTSATRPGIGFSTATGINTFLHASYLRATEAGIATDEMIGIQEIPNGFEVHIRRGKDRDFWFRLDAHKNFLPMTTLQSERLIAKSAPITTESTFEYARLAPNWWVCVGGGQVQTGPDGSVMLRTSCKIPLASIRINEHIPESAFRVDAPPGTLMFDESSKRITTVGGDQALQERVDSQVKSFGRLQPPGEAPVPVLKARESWWFAFRWPIVAIVIAIGLFAVAFRLRRA